ncbi:MAG TPA: hypothetical protein VK671_14125, partial [Mucilaginibacter sp.]|nr:hypothetical protein [Mucilaginibacter sp.]
WDGIMHANPQLEERGFVMLYNPLKYKIERQIQLPLYYTGTKNSARISVKDGTPKTYQLDKDGKANLKIAIPAEGYVWLIIE